MSVYSFGKWGKDGTVYTVDTYGDHQSNVFTAEIKVLKPKENFDDIPLGEDHYETRVLTYPITEKEYKSVLFNNHKPVTTAKNIILNNMYVNKKELTRC